MRALGRDTDTNASTTTYAGEILLGKLIIHAATTVNGAFKAPEPPPKGWFIMDPDSLQASLEMWQAADAMVLGRKTYEGLAEVWPQLADVPGYEAYAHRMNGMPKYVVSRTLTGPLTWNATLLKGDLAEGMRNLKHKHSGSLIVPGAGELARGLIAQDCVDEYWFWVHPYIWPSESPIFYDLSAIPLEFVATRTFASGVVQLCYRSRRAGTAPNQ
jgi:dihydrofolate reductase